jgi:hypothetical protein
MADLVFTEEPTGGQPRAWTVRDGETGEVLGCVGWLDPLGVYGFGIVPGSDLFSSPSRLQEVGRFLDEVNAG